MKKPIAAVNTQRTILLSEAKMANRTVVTMLPAMSHTISVDTLRNLEIIIPGWKKKLNEVYTVQQHSSNS